MGTGKALHQMQHKPAMMRIRWGARVRLHPT
jgi:hypothetical protein